MNMQSYRHNCSSIVRLSIHGELAMQNYQHDYQHDCTANRMTIHHNYAIFFICGEPAMQNYQHDFQENDDVYGNFA